MDYDLHSLIKQGLFGESHKQSVLYGILKAIKFLHSGQLVHRDLKPSNVLIKAGGTEVKLCDFGLARSIDPTRQGNADGSQALTDYVATRWYRSPELLLGCTNYTEGVDIWAIGCILAEMTLCKPIFPGHSTLDQLGRVIDMTGRPSQEDFEAIDSPLKTQLLDSIGRRTKIYLEELMPAASNEALSFMRHCFQFSPGKRSSIDDLLGFPYIAPVRNSWEELSSKEPIRIPLDDNIRLSVAEYRDSLYRESRTERELERRESNSAASTPPKLCVFPPEEYEKDDSHRSTTNTPTTCHTMKGSTTPVTPSSSKLNRSASIKILPGTLPYRTNQSITRAPPAMVPLRARPTSISRQRVPSQQPVVRSISGARAVLTNASRPSSSSLDARILRISSSSSLGGRPRAQTPTLLRRPTTSYQR